MGLSAATHLGGGDQSPPFVENNHPIGVLHCPLASPESLQEETSLIAPSHSRAVSSFSMQYFCNLEDWQKHSFWVGSVLATVASSSDFIDSVQERGISYDDDAPAKRPSRSWDSYKVLMVASTSLYLLDSVLHLAEQHHDNHNGGGGDGAEDGSLALHSTKTHFTVVFGIAACFDLVCSATEDEDFPWPSYIFSCASVYLFWICSAILLYTKRAVYCNKTRPHCDNCMISHQPISLPWAFWFLCLGDWCFLIGCTVDLYVAFIDTPFHEIGHVQSAALSLISSFFWLLDAVLYICADADIFDVVVSVDALDIDHPLILAPQDDYEDEDDITMTRCSGP